MRYATIALALLFCPLISARAQIGVGIGVPGINIGINVSAYPDLVPVPGYPIYYDPEANWNYFFYDGLYWVYQADNWYASSWYNGPWQLVGPEVCRCSCCAFRFATTASRQCTFAAGVTTRRHIGVSTGAATGKRVDADGTNGTGALLHLPHRCRGISGSIRVTAILTRRINNVLFKPSAIATNRVRGYRSVSFNRRGARPGHRSDHNSK